MDEVKAALQLGDRPYCAVQAVTGHPKRHSAEGEVDERAEEALLWTVDSIKSRFEELKERVTRDEAVREARELQSRIDKEKRVFCNILRLKAFPEEGEPTECLGEADGVEFLQDESGEKELPASALEAAKLVNYHKVATSICANLFNPVSKKKKRHSWDEVLQYVKDRRAEAGLDVANPLSS